MAMLGLILNLSWSRVEQKLGHNIAIAQYIPSPSYEAIATTEPIDLIFSFTQILIATALASLWKKISMCIATAFGYD